MNNDDPNKIDTPEEVARFEDFATRWNAINDEGENNNWLEWTNSYESTLELQHPSARERERTRQLHMEMLAAEHLAQTKAKNERRKQAELEAARARVAELEKEVALRGE